MDTTKLKDKWLAMSPKERTFTMIGAAVLVILVVGMMLPTTQAPKSKADKKTALSNLVTPTRKEVSVERLAGNQDQTDSQVAKAKNELTLAQQKIEEQRKELDALQKKQENPEQNNATADLAREVLAMKTELDAMKQGRGATNAPSSLDTPLPSASEAAPSVPVGPRLRIGGAERKAQLATTTPESEKPSIAYLPAGTIFEGVLINGMDAPTSQAAQKNPVPSVLRIKSDARLPNNFMHDVKECFVLLAGHGEMSSERVKMRTETMSCVREDGRVFEAKLDGYVTGEDGRVGVRGRLVSKQGQLIAKSFVSGVFSGLGQALTPTGVTGLNLNPTSMMQTQTMSPETIAETGVARGFSQAAKDVSKFYLSIAQEMTPVLEIDAGRKVSVVLVHGVELK